MSFWTTSGGAAATGEVTENSFDPLPKGWYTAMFEEVSVDEYENQRKIKLKARIVGEGEGNNRVLFLNLKAFEGPEIKDTARDRAIQVLVKMYGIAKAKMPNGEPDDRSLSQLTDKPMDILLDKWEIENKSGDLKSGNWLVNVEARGEKVGSAPTQKAKPAPAKSAQQKPNREPSFSDMDDDIPF